MTPELNFLVSVFQLLAIVIGILTLSFKIGRRDAVIDQTSRELEALKEITKDLVRTDIEQGRNIAVIISEMKELRHRMERLEMNRD
jgi:hypothetical protein